MSVISEKLCLPPGTVIFIPASNVDCGEEYDAAWCVNECEYKYRDPVTSVFIDLSDSVSA